MATSEDTDDGLDPISYLAEPWIRYESGSYYPICIGEPIDDGRYIVLHKLGHGGFSTVWLAYDTRSKSNVALKISTAAASPPPNRDDELHIQEEIKKAVPDSSSLLLFQRSFILSGQHSSHRVFVLPLTGPSIRDSPKDLALSIVLPAFKRLLATLASLHAAGFVHRDITHANVLWATTIPVFPSPRSAHGFLGQPRVENIPIATWKPGQLVAPCTMPPHLLGDRLYLGDFGLTTRAGAREPEGQSPAAFCAPELFHGGRPSAASDVWSFGVLFVELYLKGTIPWSSFLGNSAASVVQLMTAVLGPLPSTWQGQATFGDPVPARCYDLAQPPDPEWALEGLVATRRPEASQEERGHFVKLMSKVFRYEPGERLTAAGFLKDSDFETLMTFHVTGTAAAAA